MLVKSLVGLIIVMALFILYLVFGGAKPVVPLLPSSGVCVRRQDGFAMWSPPLRASTYCGYPPNTRALNGALGYFKDPSWMISVPVDSPINMVDANSQISVRCDYDADIEIYPLCYCDGKDIPTSFPGYRDDLSLERWETCQDLHLTSSVWGVATIDPLCPTLITSNRASADNPRWVSQGVFHLETPTDSECVRPQLPGRYLLLCRDHKHLDPYVLEIKH